MTNETNSGRPSKRVAKVGTEPGLVLVVQWRGGGAARVELAGWIETGPAPFHALMAEAVFSKPRIIDHGLAVAWGDDDDLAIDTDHIELIAERQRPMEARDFAAWQSEMVLSNREAADLLGVAQSTWSALKAGTASAPTALQIACHALKADHSLFAALYKPRRAAGRPKKVA
ncbi:MAG: hypothetical protein AB7P02_09340 [Alphaproteobacteria bacterium]